MSIKNWTVTTQRIKNKSEGLSEYTSYLVSAKHKNHKNTEVVAIFNKDHNKFLNNTINEVIEFDANNKKGGRKVESYAQSFNFILPPPHKPSADQWKKIAIDLVQTIHKELDIKGDVSKFGNACFINLHDQANPHLNMLVPRIFSNERLADLDRKNVLAKLKLQFNQSVMKHCEIDHTHHKPLRSNVGPRKSAQRYAYDKAKEEAENALKLITEASEAQSQAALATKKLEVQKSQISILFNAYNRFKSSLMKWIKSAKEELKLDTMVNRQDLEKSANFIINSKLVSDEDAILVEKTVFDEFEELEKNGVKTEKPLISSRRTKLKAS
jgi:hypothetical protein